MNCRLIFWGNTSYRAKNFRIKKNIIRIIMGYRSRDSCTDIFKKLNILPCHLQ